MKYKCIFALGAAAALCLFSACGTSHMSDSISASNSDMDVWTAEVSTMTTAETTTEPSPQLPAPSQGSQDVTEQYEEQFVGSWLDDDRDEIWTFKARGSLIVTDRDSDGDTDSYTWWIEDDGKQVLLFLFENGDDDADKYSFTFSGENLTLYDTISGSAEEMLSRISEATEPPAPDPTYTEQEAAKENGTDPDVSNSPAPTAAVSTAAPAPAAPVSPEPTMEIEVASDVTLTRDINEALPMVECALDAVLDGVAFDPADAKSFWSIMARYLSRYSDSDADGYFTVSEERVRDTAEDLFAGFDDDRTEIPDCSESDGLAQKVGGGYQIRWGVTGGHDMEVVSFDGREIMEVQADGALYEVKMDEDGEIISIQKR